MFIKLQIMADLTLLLNAAAQGNTKASEELLVMVYDELRSLAAQKMVREAAGHTLQATELVHEAWLRVKGGESTGWQNRAHFFGAAAEAMRRILVDHARRRHAQRRGGGAEQVELEESMLVLGVPDDEILAVNEALDALAAEDPVAADVVKLRFFAGMTMEETASVLGMSKRTAESLWTYARAWLHQKVRH